MEEKKLIPRRRFIKFRGEWNGTILQENSSLITKGTTPKNSMSSGPINFIKVENIKNGFVYPKTKISLEEHEGFLKRSKLESGDILFSIAGTLGRVSIVDESILPANTNQALAIIRGYSYDSSFLLTYLSGKAITEYIRKNPTIGAQPNLSLQQIGGFLVYSPTMKEQQKIGEFFKVLDERIANQERKIAKVKALKKAYLTEMFPQEGETLPKRRFKGFEGEWEKRKVSELFKVTRGDVLSTTKISKTRTSSYYYPVYSSQTLNNGLLGYYNKYLFDTAITWTTDGANAGTVNYREGKFYSTNVNGVLISTEGYACKAIAEALNLIAWKYVSKVGNPKLMNNVMSDIELFVPKRVKELELISNFFQNLDDQIRVEEAKLEKLKKMKEAYLEEMFV